MEQFEEEGLERITHHKSSLNASKEIFYGAMSGMLGKIVEFPFDTIKVRLQATSSAGYSQSTMSCIQQTYQREGLVNGFYQGIKAPLLGACLENAILFASYNITSEMFIKNLKLKSNDDLPLWTKCASGGFAGFTASFILTPIELVKCKLQVLNLSSGAGATTSAGNNIYGSIIRSVIQKDGVTGLWSGLSSTLVREVFGTAIWFGTYEYFTEVFRRQRGKGAQNTDLESMVSGAFAGVFFNFSMFPADTIKSNIQINDNFKNVSFWKVGKWVCKQPGGIKNLYNGLGITLVRSVPANAIIFYSYELLKRNLH